MLRKNIFSAAQNVKYTTFYSTEDGSATAIDIFLKSIRSHRTSYLLLFQILVPLLLS